jgi:hypothetical protein
VDVPLNPISVGVGVGANKDGCRRHESGLDIVP